jgi:predicted HicB family RNase H-like nuclease
MNTMTYQGYTARIDFDDRDNLFVGRLLGIRDVIGFHADSVAELRAAFEEAVGDYLETCAALGKSPDKSVSFVVS